MAKNESEKDVAAPAPATAPQTVTVVMSSPQHAAQQLAKELSDLRDSGIKLDETKPGGRFMGTDGRYHDAHGNVFGDSTASGDVAGLGFDAVNHELHEMEQRRLALLGRIEAARAEALQASAQKTSAP